MVPQAIEFRWLHCFLGIQSSSKKRIQYDSMIEYSQYSPIKPGKSTFYHGTKNRWEWFTVWDAVVFFGNWWSHQGLHWVTQVTPRPCGHCRPETAIGLGRLDPHCDHFPCKIMENHGKSWKITTSSPILLVS